MDQGVCVSVCACWTEDVEVNEEWAQKKKGMMQIQMRQETVTSKGGWKRTETNEESHSTLEITLPAWMHLQERLKKSERGGRRERRDTDKEREGQGEVYHMESEKTES